MAKAEKRSVTRLVETVVDEGVTLHLSIEEADVLAALVYSALIGDGFVRATMDDITLAIHKVRPTFRLVYDQRPHTRQLDVSGARILGA